MSSTRWGREDAVDFAGHVALQAAHDLTLGQPFLGSARDVGSGSLVGAHSAHDDHVQGGVGLAVAATVETVALRLPTRCGDRADAAHHGEARLGVEPVRVIPNGDHDCACVFGAHAFEFEQTGRELLDQWNDEAVELGDLVIEIEDSASEVFQGELDDIDLAAGGVNANPESLEVVVPDNALALLAGQCGYRDAPGWPEGLAFDREYGRRKPGGVAPVPRRA